MVPNEQEDHSQEEEDIPLLEGLHWESLIGISSPGSSRKRSLSESSLAPASAPALFMPVTSKETREGERLGPEQQVSSASAALAAGITGVRCKQEAEETLCQAEAEAPKLTARALQRSDSMLGDSSSGTEQCDGQGTGKRRRAAGVSLLAGLCVD